MYDVHAHVLPGIDDGARTAEEALEMARVAHRDGTRVMLATPHRRDVGERTSLEAVRGLVAELNQQMERHGLELRVALGMENHLDPDLLADVQAGKALCMNGSRYILVELDFFQYPHYTDEVIFQLQIQGLTPVIAHPERQAQLQANPELLVRLAERGVLAQLTAGSLLGSFGRGVQRVARRMVRRRLVQVLASDCHRPNRHRSPVLSAGAAEVARLCGEEVARAMVVDTPRALVEDLPIPPPEPLAAPPRRWWAFWRKS